MRNLIFALLLAGTAHAQPKIEPAKEKDIRKLLQLTGAAQIGVQTMSQVIESYKQAAPSVPADFWDRFQKDVDPNELVLRVLPLYDKHFSDREIRDIIAFYQTPTGKKMIKEMPVVSKELMVVGQEWGKEIGEKVWARLKAEEQKQTKKAEEQKQTKKK